MRWRGGAWPLLALGLLAAQGATAQQPVPGGPPAAADAAPAASGALPAGMPVLPDGLLEGAAPSEDSTPPADVVQAPQQTLDPKTLADMRGQLVVIGRALQSLRAELVASGPAGFTAAGGAPAIERMDQMEAQIARLTGAVEEMRNRVEGSIAQAANHAGDIEFRLCEMDPGCDLGALTTAQLDDAIARGAAPAPGQGATPTASGPGAGPGADGPAASDAPPTGTPVENAEFDRAAAVLSAGDHARAARLFADFAGSNPASTLVPEAMFMRGQALAAGGDTQGAAAAWLDAFAAAPAGPRAPQALLAVAGAMAGAGKTEDACAFYADVPVRFPATPAALEAATRAEALNCAAAPDAAAPTSAPPADPSTGRVPQPQGSVTDPEEAGDLADVGG